MGDVGVPELLLILGIVLLLFGPQKLPGMGKAIGQAIREFKKALQAEPPEDAPTSPPPEPAARREQRTSPTRRGPVHGGPSRDRQG